MRARPCPFRASHNPGEVVVPVRLRTLVARWKWRTDRSAVDPETGRVRVAWRPCPRCPDGGWVRTDVRRPLCPWCKDLVARLNGRRT